MRYDLSVVHSLHLTDAPIPIFKTLYISSAGNSRLLADFFSLAGFVRYERPDQRAKMIHRFSLLSPVIALILCFTFKDPRQMVIVGGFAQGLMLPLISGVTVFFRYRRTDRRITPGLLLDILLWVAFVLITCVAMYAAQDQIGKWTAPPAVVKRASRPLPGSCERISGDVPFV